MAGYWGTLAAVRCLGRAGIPVTVASDAGGQPAAWSRWTTRRVPCPRPGDPERFMEWLLRFGEREPGHVLYPTCDDLAYLFARHAAEIRKWFLVYQPPLQAVLAVLDKKSLLLAAKRAGIESVTSWFPEDDAAVASIAREARFPLLIKPRTQVLWPTLHKGTRVDRPEDLPGAYSRHLQITPYYLPMLLAEHPELARPLLQEYHSVAEEQIHSVAGFIDASGGIFVARAATKVLQRPRRVGIGVCFEDVPLHPATADAVARLCREAGYHGVFEAEFIRSGDRDLLIDFNPRYYNQMGFEIARGLPLPLLVHAAARGDEERLRALARGAQSSVGTATAYCYRLALGMIVGAQGLSGHMRPSDVRRWWAWYVRHRKDAVDGAFDREDMLPALLAAGKELWSALRHPRAFLRSIAMNV
jgi:predicted ATP-grasp superfamily ATP-dependent carboligase